MAHVRVSFDDLPNYRWPIHKDPGSVGYTLIQATNEEGSEWIPKWVLVDADGENLAVIDIDDLDPDPKVASREVAEAALRVVQDIHGITAEETGLDLQVAPAFPVRQAPPE